MEFIGVPRTKFVEVLDYASSKFSSYVLNVPFNSRIARNNISVGGASFVDIVPAWDSTFFKKNGSTGADEDQIVAKCGDFAYRIILDVRISIRSFSDASTISRHGDLVLRKVHHPDRSVLDLGHCQIGGEEKTKGHPHLMLRFSETSLLIGDNDGGRLLSGVVAFVSWGNKRWFQVIGTW